MTGSSFVSIFFFYFTVMVTVGSQQVYRVHSHNDYQQAVPFWLAYSSEAASIEVDLFLKEGKLYVTHEEDEIVPSKTFERLYLEPLNTLANAGELRELQLLIDIKSEAYTTLDRVIAVIETYPSLINNDKLKFVISGERPNRGEYIKYPDHIKFDHQSLLDLDTVPLDKVAMISQSFEDYSVWNGYGRLTTTDLNKVNEAIDRTKMIGKPFRFWGTPDTKTAWSAFAKLGVAYINTDDPARAHDFLATLDNRAYMPEHVIETYQPQYELDANATPQNIILMIGDGNGLAQITSALIANRGELTISNIKNVGLVNTSSADDLVTDSAAGGTAMATGVKTNNRAIGVSPDGDEVSTIIEILSAKGYNTGIITSDAIYGATPSSFYAHTVERDDTDKIIEDLIDSELDIFVSGGSMKSDAIDRRFSASTLGDIQTLERPTAVYFGDSKMPSMNNGRGDVMVRSTKKVLQLLKKAKAPFFLLVEGAQIDNGGHSNNISTIVSEMLDFDQVVGEALRFADHEENTLVIITADHETGGLGIAGGDEKTGTVRADFLSVDHSGILVPVFAYGPQSKRFTGFLDNTMIFYKMLETLGVSVD